MQIDDLNDNLMAIATEIDQKVLPARIVAGYTMFGKLGAASLPVTQYTKTAIPSKSGQTIIPDIGYDALEKVKVSAVTSSIDENIVAGNIKYGTQILGVNGTLSNLTQEEYIQALDMQNQILGYQIYYINGKLVINTASVTDDTISVTGTVTDDKVVLN